MRLCGKQPVLERLKRAPDTIKSLYLQQGVNTPEVVRAIQAAGRSFESLSKSAFLQRVGSLHAQGVLAEVEPFRYTPLETLLRPKGPIPCLLLLDRITDPQNLGAILRTTACLGSFALVLPKHESAEINETVLRVACGGENHMPVARETNLARACELAKKAGYWIAGAAPAGGTPLHTTDWPTPLAIILGAEGNGIRPGLAKQLDLRLTLPMPGADLSYNVATAAALIAYEVTRRRLLK